jgi:hypothetical protein
MGSASVGVSASISQTVVPRPDGVDGMSKAQEYRVEDLYP